MLAFAGGRGGSLGSNLFGGLNGLGSLGSSCFSGALRLFRRAAAGHEPGQQTQRQQDRKEFFHW